MPNNKIYKTTILGKEKKCPKCGDWWPYDLEFWHHQKRKNGNDGLTSWCSGCVSQHKLDKRLGVLTNQ